MVEKNNIKKYIPLSETTFYILAALNEPLHGYAIMQKVENMSRGLVKLGPGTLYGAFSTLEKEKIIIMVDERNRRKVYSLTEKGGEVLRLQIERLKIMLENV
jgi:DNA-binding PadR family transcriptional regulator